MVPNIGAVQARMLLEHFNDAESIFKAPRKELVQLEGIGEIKAHAIKSFLNFKAAEEEIKFIEKYQITPLFIQSKNYPQRLLNCYDAPIMLFYKGVCNLNQSKIISIIGTRNNTDYGKQLVEDLLEELNLEDVIIVSGMAYGIDAIAHKTSLQKNIQTVAVLAHGLNSIYPNIHKNLAKEVSIQGGLLTEFLHHEKADKHNFPKRNRIVAGMADCTIVIETALKGGSMITAELANSYNRDVFAFPGKVYDAKSEGCNYLIQNNKAILLTNAHQLKENMGWNDLKKIPKKQKELFIQLTKEEEIIVSILNKSNTVHIDEIYIGSGLSGSQVAAAMLNLELQNVIHTLPGKLYKLQ
jgi:DNA processing protein